MASIFKRFSKEKAVSDAEVIDIPVNDGKKKIPLKVWLIIAGVVLVIALIIGIVIFVTARKNDGARYAEKLSEHLGVSLYSAGADAGLDMNAAPVCTYLADAEEDFDAICESQKMTEVGGVTVPQWAIFCFADNNGKLDQINYYDYTLLKKHTTGVKTDGYILLTDIVNGMHREEALEIVGIDPYCISYFSSGTRQYKFKYCYKDDTTKDMMAYTITLLFDVNDNVAAVIDKQYNFVADYMTVQ